MQTVITHIRYSHRNSLYTVNNNLDSGNKYSNNIPYWYELIRFLNFYNILTTRQYLLMQTIFKEIKLCEEKHFTEYYTYICT